jgi:hypothetical protein
MTRRAISIAPFVPVLILLIVALNSARMGGWQLTGPRGWTRMTLSPISSRTAAGAPGTTRAIENSRDGLWRLGSEAPRKIFGSALHPNQARLFASTGLSLAKAIMEKCGR